MAISKIKKFGSTWCAPCRVLKQNLEGFTRVSVEEIESTWCAPCRVLKQNLEGFTRVSVEEIDVEANMDEATKYGIRNIPVLIYFDSDGNEVDRTVGLVTVQKINEIIDKHETD